MKKLLVVGTALSGLLTFVNSAVAADPVAAYIANWSGFYVGLQGGYATGDATHSFFVGAPNDNSNPDGFFGGIHAGYLMQQDHLVFGLEGDIEAADINGHFNNFTGATSSGSTDINWQGSGRLRLGYATGQFLPYVTGGVAVADVDYGGGPAPGPCCGFSKTAVGFTIGGGLEYSFSEALSANIEYRYTDFGTKRGALAPSFPGVVMPVKLTTSAVRIGVSYHF